MSASIGGSSAGSNGGDKLVMSTEAADQEMRTSILLAPAVLKLKLNSAIAGYFCATSASTTCSSQSKPGWRMARKSILSPSCVRYGYENMPGYFCATSASTTGLTQVKPGVAIDRRSILTVSPVLKLGSIMPGYFVAMSASVTGNTHVNPGCTTARRSITLPRTV